MIARQVNNDWGGKQRETVMAQFKIIYAGRKPMKLPSFKEPDCSLPYPQVTV